MDCFPDFCLGCDSQATDGFYCSEACRMLDLSRSGSGPASPDSSISISSGCEQFVFPVSIGQPPSRYPPPPTKSRSSTSLSSKSHHHHRQDHQDHHGHHGHNHSWSTGALTGQYSPHRGLSPSSSRSSLVSHGQPEVVSQEAARELRSYFSAFDRTREQRRKSVPVNRQLHWTARSSDKNLSENH